MISKHIQALDWNFENDRLLTLEKGLIKPSSEYRQNHFRSEQEFHIHMATLGSWIVTLQRGAVEFDIRVDQRVTTEQLGCMFSVQPDTVWLSAENKAFFSSDGAFDLATENIAEYTIVTVRGDKT